MPNAIHEQLKNKKAPHSLLNMGLKLNLSFVAGTGIEPVFPP